MPKKHKFEIVCPYCNKTLGKQGIYGHIRGNHPDKEEEYRKNNPPKMSSIRNHTPYTPEPTKDEPEKETMTEEEKKPIPEPEKPQEVPKPEPKPEPVKEEPKPEPKPEPKKEGEQKPKKGKSFLDWIFSEEEEDDTDESSVSKPKTKEKDFWDFDF